jgi:hypothetical protein
MAPPIANMSRKPTIFEYNLPLDGEEWTQFEARPHYDAWDAVDAIGEQILKSRDEVDQERLKAGLTIKIRKHGEEATQSFELGVEYTPRVVVREVQ